MSHEGVDKAHSMSAAVVDFLISNLFRVFLSNKVAVMLILVILCTTL